MSSISGARPAGLPRRLGAMLYDGLLIIGIWMFTLFPLVAISGVAVSGPGVQSLLFVEVFGFFCYFWMRRGQTVGMLAWGLKVHSLNGDALSLRQALLRFIGALLGLATFGTGYLWMLIDPGGRTWSDLLSRTEVTYVPRSQG